MLCLCVFHLFRGFPGGFVVFDNFGPVVALNGLSGFDRFLIAVKSDFLASPVGGALAALIVVCRTGWYIGCNPVHGVNCVSVSSLPSTSRYVLKLGIVLPLDLVG